MKKLILFHGTPDKIVVPTYGKGEERRDYGQDFYLTESIDFAKEQAVYRLSNIRALTKSTVRVTLLSWLYCHDLRQNRLSERHVRFLHYNFGGYDTD